MHFYLLPQVVYNNLKRLYKTHACYEHNHVFPLLEERFQKLSLNVK